MRSLKEKIDGLVQRELVPISVVMEVTSKNIYR